MRPFQMITRIIIATSVVNCAPVPVMPVAGRSDPPLEPTYMGLIPDITVSPPPQPPSRPPTPPPPPADHALLRPPPPVYGGAASRNRPAANSPTPEPKLTKSRTAVIALGVAALAATIGAGAYWGWGTKHPSRSIRSSGNDAISRRLAKLADDGGSSDFWVEP